MGIRKRAMMGTAMSPVADRRGSLFDDVAHQGASQKRQQTIAWSPASRPSTAETQRDRKPVSARARDLVRNYGPARGALKKSRAQIIGPGLRLRSKPNAKALGVPHDEALRFAREIEQVFNSWAISPDNQCDVRGLRSFGQMLGTAWSDRLVAGENLMVIRQKPKRGTKFATCLQEVDPDRLNNPLGKPDDVNHRQGIELNNDGAPTAYHIQDRHPLDEAITLDRLNWTRMPRHAPDGRRVVIHGFFSDRSEQIRGMSAFAPVLIALRDITRMSEAEIGAATINATFAGFVQSSFDELALGDALGLDTGAAAGSGSSFQDLRDQIYGDGLSIHDNQLASLAPGDSVEIPNTSRATGPFSDFKKSFLQDVAAALGIAYPVLAEDWEGVNYSSARAALAEVWRLVTEDRSHFIRDTVMPIFCEVIDEAFLRGFLVEPEGWPTYEDNKAAYLQASWTGPGRGYVDPLKEAQANALLMEMGVLTLDELCAEQGKDWEEVIAQKALERDRLEELGFAPLEISGLLRLTADTSAAAGGADAPAEDRN